MSLKTTSIKIRYHNKYLRIFISVILLVTGAVIAKLPLTGTLVEAAASFLSVVAHDSTLTGDGTVNSPLGIASTGVGTTQLANGAVTSAKIGSGQVVKSVNGLSDAVTLGAGSNVSLALSGQTLTISSLLGLTSVAHDSTLAGNGTTGSVLGIQEGSITTEHIASGNLVRALNNLHDNVTLVGGSNITITQTGNDTLTIAANVPPPLPESSPQPYVNPLRVATLQWYEAIETGLEFSPGLFGASQIAFDGANMWVSRSTWGSVAKIRVSDGALLGTFHVTGGDASGVAFDGSNIWVACGDSSSSLAKLRASDGANLGTFTLPADPFGLAFDGSHIWATNGGGITKVRARDGVIVDTFNVGALTIAFDGKNIWGTNPQANTVTKIRASDGVLLGTFNVPSSPQRLAFDGANIWISHPVLNLVTKLRASDGVILGTFSVGPFPLGIAFDGANIWVANRSSNTVTKLRASDGMMIGTFITGTGPGSLAFDGANIWVVNTGAATLSKL